MFSSLAPALGPEQKNWLCHPFPLFMGGGNGATHVAFKQNAAFVADTIWGFLLESTCIGE